MSKKEFKLPPLSPLIGSDLSNYLKVTRQGHIEQKFKIKYILTAAIIGILTPFRWYEKWRFRKIGGLRLESPVFILGHWRSGTTHLHNILCQSPSAGFVTTFQTVFTQYLASSKILKPFMGILMPDKRPSDNVKLNVEYPQEEEFALSNITTRSYYHFFYFPDLVNDYFHKYVRFEGSDEESWKKSYDHLLKKAWVNMPGTDYLVIKNPVNTGRYKVLKKLYPDARFIHIYRNPYTVFLSTKKFFVELMPTLWFQEISEDQIEKMILEKYVDFMDAYYSDTQGEDTIYELRFEEFEKDPLKHMADLYEKLGIKGYDLSAPHFSRYISSQKSYRKNKYSISRREANLVKKYWGSYLERWKYDIPENMNVVD